MRRREFVGLVGTRAVARRLAVRAQHRPIPVIGFLDSTSLVALTDRRRAFRFGPKEAGFVEAGELIE
jgi:hypothetical protein